MRFPDVIIEHNYKDDAAHDPYMVWQDEEKRFLLYELKRPISKESFLGEVTPEQIFEKRKIYITTDIIRTMRRLTEQTFVILEAAWAKLGVTLVDLKIECGALVKDEIVVADVIDNDSWRIWPGGDKSKQLDKQSYRELVAAPSPEDIAKLKGNYAHVAELTKSFLED
jgi:phosphoribosylaminoimidazole-succinocarboxamide synthase